MPPRDDVTAAIHELIETLNARHSENIDRLAVTDRKVEEAIRRIDALHEAFPDDDTIGHRMYHESLIKKIEARTRMFDEIRTHLFKNGLWIGLGFIAYAMWQAFKAKVIG